MPLSIQIIKRIIDILISVLALTLLSPILAIIAVAIKLDSPGNVLYKQERVRKAREQDDRTIDIQTFWIYKFRTMVQNAEKQTGAVNAAEDDSRITRIGKIIRPIRFDEIPNLINVLKGEMSVVGPRADRVEIFKQVEKSFPLIWYRSQYVKPGITGIAQLHLRSDGSLNGDEDFSSAVASTDLDLPVESFRFKLYYDFAYVLKMTKFWSFLKTDLSIMLRTPYVMFIRRNTI